VPGAGPHIHSNYAAGLRGHGVLALTEGDGVTGLLAQPDGDAALEKEAGKNAVWAIGDLVPRAELRLAIDDLRVLIAVGLRATGAGRMRVEDHLAEMLLARSPHVGERVRAHALGPLEDYSERRGADLLDTLATFIDYDLDRRRAAAALHVHPNTLDYRLRRAEELTGLKLSSTGDLLLLCLALKQRALAGL
jgi:sugar diacid utilization regulator